MKKFEITEEQIKELAERFGSDNQTKLRSELTNQLKEWFPKAFETKLEVGKWYTPKNEYESKCVWFVTKNECLENVGYGIDFLGNWSDNFDVSGGINNIRLATDQEVFESLKNEAIKRGLIDGAHYTWPNVDFKRQVKFPLILEENGILTDCNYNYLFHKGKWAEIIKTYTKEEAEQLLNAKII